jgi:hypothetical protein
MYGLIWTDPSLDELADIWVACSPAERGEVEAAILRLDPALMRDPTAVGESRGGSRRVAFETPLVVWFTVSDADRVVRVTHVAKPH